jgi:hypothetical protein
MYIHTVQIDPSMFYPYTCGCLLRFETFAELSEMIILMK